ncbi:MAG: helix-turn-helix domain-containing protein [Patescibacteria group bacterium]
MEKIAPILKSLGLLDSEVNTYLSALEKGPSTVIDLSKASKLSRQATYTAIEMLTERGLMSSVVRGKKRFYSAEPPSKLLAYAKRKDAEMHDQVRDLESLVPDLELRVGGERPVVKVFEGKEGIKTIIQDIQNSASNESYEITDADALYDVLKPEDLKELRGTLQKRNKKIKGIYAGKLGPKGINVQRKLLSDKESGFKANIGIYGNSVAMVTFSGKMYSLLIESPPLAKALKILFDHAYNDIEQED